MRRSIAIAAVLVASCGGPSGNRQAAEDGNAATPAGGGGTTAAVAMQPGQWEIVTEVVRMDVPNMPKGVSAPTPPPTTVRTCLTPQQAGAPSGGFLTGSGEGGGCTSRNMSMAGGRIQGVVQCDQQGSTMRSTMDGRFSPTSFEVNQQVETSAQGMNMTIQSRTSGRRVGDCPS
jgi:hypothetical protein